MKKTLGYIGLGVLGVLIVLVANSFYADLSVEELIDTYANEQSQFIEIQGSRVHYRIEGEGPNLLLLHGTASSLHTWDGWNEQLKDHFRIIRLDLPAFGLTGPSAARDYRIAAYTAFLHEFVEAIELERFSLAGNSLGGGIAWSFAAEFPDKVEKLILVDASGIPDNRDDPAVFKMARNPVLGKLLEYITPKSFIKKNMKEVYFDDGRVTDELVSRYHDMALRAGNRVAFRDRASAVNPDITDKLPSIMAPTLIIWGQEDEWIPVDNAAVFAERIPNAAVVIIENVGHVPMEEAPETSANIVLKFLLNP